MHIIAAKRPFARRHSESFINGGGIRHEKFTVTESPAFDAKIPLLLQPFVTELEEDDTFSRKACHKMKSIRNNTPVMRRPIISSSRS